MSVTGINGVHIRPDSNDRIRFTHLPITRCSVIKLETLPVGTDLGLDLYFHHTHDNDELVAIMDSLIEAAKRIRRDALVRSNRVRNTAEDERARMALANQPVRVD